MGRRRASVRKCTSAPKAEPRNRGFCDLPDATRSPNSSPSAPFANEFCTPVCHLRHSLGEKRSQSSAVHVWAATVPHAHGAGGSAFA
jgi:hypothetical protein